MGIVVSRREVGLRDVLGEQLGDAFTIEAGTVSSPLPVGYYKMKAATACIVRVGRDLEDASGGEPFEAGEKEVYFLRKGSVIAVDEA